MRSEHRDYLAARGITDPEVMVARGYSSTDQGLRIPIFGLTEGMEVGHELRLDTPKGDGQKFTRPKNQGNRLNVAPYSAAHVQDVDQPLWIVEGTTRADALAQRGQAAASITGCWGWKNGKTGTLSDFHDIPFRQRTVIIGPDADAFSKPQVNRAIREFCEFLGRKGARPHVLRLDGDQGIDDYLASGGTVDDLRGLAVSGREVPIVAEQSDGPKIVKPNTVELAERWLNDDPHAAYLIDTGEWLAFDGKQWRNDTKSRALSRSSVNDTLREIVDETDELAETGEERASARGVRNALFDYRTPGNVLTQAESMPESHAYDTDFDADHFLFNVDNGVLDLRTQELLPHAPEYKQRGITRVAWDAESSSPEFDAFMRRILPDDEVRQYLQAFFGSSLAATPAEQVLPILQGAGANGKSVLLGVLQSVLGSEYAAPIDKKLLLAKGKPDHQTNIMALRGKRLVTASETDAGDKLALASVKQLTGGDQLTGRGIGKDQVSFRPTHNLVMLTNSRPEIDGADKAIWRRLRIVPFEEIIPEEEQDRGLERRIVENEASGVLRWLVDGFRIWQDEGGQLPECWRVNVATLEYQMDENSFAAFMDEAVESDPKAATLKSEVSEAWRTWKAHNWDAKDMSAREFNDAMRGAGFTEKNSISNGSKGRCWIGMKLVPPYDGQAVQQGINSFSTGERSTNPPVTREFNNFNNFNSIFRSQSRGANLHGISEEGKTIGVTPETPVEPVEPVESAGQGATDDHASCRTPVEDPVELEQRPDETTYQHYCRTGILPIPPEPIAQEDIPLTRYSGPQWLSGGPLPEGTKENSPRARFWQMTPGGSPMLQRIADLLEHFAKDMTEEDVELFRDADTSLDKRDGARNHIRAMYHVTLDDLYAAHEGIPHHPQYLRQIILNARNWLEEARGLIVRFRRTDGPIDKFRDKEDKAVPQSKMAFFIARLP